MFEPRPGGIIAVADPYCYRVAVDGGRGDLVPARADGLQEQAIQDLQVCHDAEGQREYEGGIYHDDERPEDYSHGWVLEEVEDKRATAAD